jgi:hypothetical protein
MGSAPTRQSSQRAWAEPSTILITGATGGIGAALAPSPSATLGRSPRKTRRPLLQLSLWTRAHLQMIDAQPAGTLATIH